jgi:hypothetical protein
VSGVCGCGRRRRAEVTCSAFGSNTSMDCSAATRSELTSDRKLGGLMSGELGGLTGVLRGGEVAAALNRGALFIISRGARRMMATLRLSKLDRGWLPVPPQRTAAGCGSQTQCRWGGKSRRATA